MILSTERVVNACGGTHREEASAVVAAAKEGSRVTKEECMVVVK